MAEPADGRAAHPLRTDEADRGRDDLDGLGPGFDPGFGPGFDPGLRLDAQPADVRTNPSST